MPTLPPIMMQQPGEAPTGRAATDNEMQEALRPTMEVTPEQRAAEVGAKAPLEHGVKLASEIDLTKSGQELTALMEDQHIPGTDKPIEDAIFGTLIPSLRRSITFQERFRDNLVNALSKRDKKYTFAAPELNQTLNNLFGNDTASTAAGAVAILGQYEGQRRRDRLSLYDKKVSELYSGYESLREGIDAAVANGTMSGEAAAAMLTKFDREHAKLLGAPFAHRAASRAVVTSLLAESSVKWLNNLETRKQVIGNLTKTMKRVQGQIDRSKSASALTRGRAYENLPAIYAVCEKPTDPAAMQKAGFSDPWSYRLMEIAEAALGRSEPLIQIRNVLVAKNPRAAIKEAVQNAQLSPEEVYGVALGLYEVLQTMKLQSDAAKVSGVPNPNGRGITDQEFISLASRLTPLVTEPAVTAHVNMAGALATVMGAVYRAPKDVRDAADDASGETTGDLGTLSRLLQVFQAVSPAAEEFYSSLPAGGSVLNTRALHDVKASLARQYGQLEELDSLTEGK